ncbi:NAD-dependent epimerase/dehydratase family protein [Streptomyces sp. NPDC055400]
MNIFDIGATGFVGGALARHLSAEGHTVTGLARTETAAAGLTTRGILPAPGDLDERRPAVVEAALAADAVVYAAQAGPEQETATVQDLSRALTGTDKTLIFLSGSGVLPQRTAGAWGPDVFAEDDPFTPEPLADFRKAAEDTVLAAAKDGLRAMVIRPGLIWGPADHGHLSMVYQSVAATGAACYIGEGLNTYSHVHVDDVTRLFTLALAKGHPGGLCLPPAHLLILNAAYVVGLVGPAAIGSVAVAGTAQVGSPAPWPSPATTSAPWSPSRGPPPTPRASPT